MALNAHSYGDLLLYPFGYASNMLTPDDAVFKAYTDQMVSENGFNNMISSGLYPAAGDSDDWGYAGDLNQKPKVLALTPEIGSDNHGFWPATSEIEDICKSTIHMNLTAAHLTYVFGVVKDDNSTVISDLNGYLKFNLQRLGMESGNLTVAIVPVGFGVTSVGAPKTYNPTTVLDIENDSISYVLDPNILIGQQFQYALSISNGFYTWKDTITKVYGQSDVIIADNGNSLTNWTSNSWNTTTLEFFSPNASITDSPGNGIDYPNGATSYINLNQTIDLTNVISAN